MVLWLKIPLAHQASPVGIETGIHRHAGNHPDAKAKTDVGFDNVSIGGGEDDTRRQPGAVKGGIQLGAAGKPKGIGDQRVLASSSIVTEPGRPADVQASRQSNGSSDSTAA